MSRIKDAAGLNGELGPKSLWEAVGRLSRVHDEQEKAIRDHDMHQFNHLLSEQAVAWAYVKTFVLQLIQQGKAPEDVVERLRKVLDVQKQREQELEEAKQRLEEKPCRDQDKTTNQNFEKAA